MHTLCSYTWCGVRMQPIRFEARVVAIERPNGDLLNRVLLLAIVRFLEVEWDLFYK
jgi:hypothetical protein